MYRNTRRVAAILGLLAVAIATAWAHEKGILKPATRTLTAGDTLAVVGEKLPKRERITLRLVGVGGRIALDTVQADSAGAFAARVLVPGSVPPGAYRLVAVADDGDEVATLDVTVVAAAPAADHAAMDHADEALAAAEPSADPLVLDRARSAAVTWSAVGAIVLALGLGGALLRRPPPAA
jgi:hypothetical protein